ncbi:hypothetical protein C8E03_11912 [Lachnotalea glycerini]|uniref:Uncharacterized protein n=1 Tax=Lachnotalea glycerini TaxID=1763509 RepID=A0A318EJ43_9FIRM|nr:hypothetical protein [Lachnotalea glycerini]PXV85088.1 hypothetical protein C8E03_11912 [Lachnotalea glycerini]
MGLFKPKLRKDIEEKIKNLSPKSFISVGLTAGLPLPETTTCQLYYCDDRIEIDGNNVNFVLPFNKIQDISIKTSVEIAKNYVSSAGGAVAGAVLFGAVGALIGGRVKTKTEKNLTSYLIFTYIDDNNEVKYIGFDVTYTPKSKEFVTLYENQKDNMQTIIL